MDREPPESLREAGSLAQAADKEYGLTVLEERAGTHVAQAEGSQGSDALSMAIAGADFNQLFEGLGTGDVGCRVCGCEAHFVFCEGDLASAERTCFWDSCWLVWHLSHGTACEAVALTAGEGELLASGPSELLDEPLVEGGLGRRPVILGRSFWRTLSGQSFLLCCWSSGTRFMRSRR